MQFLNDIRTYVEEFSSEANDEIHRFIDFLKDKYEAIQPKEAVVAPPIADAIGTGTSVVADQSVAAAVSDAPVAEASPADAPAVPADASGDDASQTPSVETVSDSAASVVDESAVVTPASTTN